LDLKNTIKEKLHRAYKKDEIEKHHLQYLFLEITKKCNLNCLHCGSDCSKDVHSPELTTESWIKIIDYFKNVFSENVVFVITGGEPLVHPGLISIASHIHANGMRWGMVSNGMLLNQQMLKKLTETGISSITISLDGPKEAHNWLRNHQNAFEKAIEAIKLTAQSVIPYQDVVTCVSPKNLHDLDQIAELLIENKMKEWRIFRIFPSGRAVSDAGLYLSFEQTQTLLHWVKTNKLKYIEKGLNINLSCEGWLPFDLDRKVRDYPFFCRSGINTASILSDGTITGCSNNSKAFHVGNILKDNFANLWENQFDIFRNRNWLANTSCNACKHVKSCMGGSIHLWEHGKSKPNFCYTIDFDSKLEK
jgi:radical SAM protein with 4Fe4S-binding SPASM domain